MASNDRYSLTRICKYIHPPCSLIHIVVIVTRSRSAVSDPGSSRGPTRLKPGLLKHGCLLILKDPNHVAGAPTAFTRLEVLAARVARRQQEHHSVPQKAHAGPLLVAKIVNILFKLALLRIILRDESNHTLDGVLIHVFEISAVRHIQIMVLIAQVAHYI